MRAAGDGATDGDDTISVFSLQHTPQDDDSLLASYTHPPEIVNPTTTVGPGRIDLGAACTKEQVRPAAVLAARR